MGRNKPPHCIGPKMSVPQLSASIRGQQQMVRASSILWHSQSSTISNRSCERTALAGASFLSCLRSSFSRVAQNPMVPAQHLSRLILFLTTYSVHVISMLTLYWRHGHSLDQEMALMVFSALVLLLSS